MFLIPGLSTGELLPGPVASPVAVKGPPRKLFINPQSGQVSGASGEEFTPESLTDEERKRAQRFMAGGQPAAQPAAAPDPAGAFESTIAKPFQTNVVARVPRGQMDGYTQVPGGFVKLGQEMSLANSDDPAQREFARQHFVDRNRARFMDPGRLEVQQPPSNEEMARFYQMMDMGSPGTAVSYLNSVKRVTPGRAPVDAAEATKLAENAFLQTFGRGPEQQQSNTDRMKAQLAEYEQKVTRKQETEQKAAAAQLEADTRRYVADEGSKTAIAAPILQGAAKSAELDPENAKTYFEAAGNNAAAAAKVYKDKVRGDKGKDIPVGPTPTVSVNGGDVPPPPPPADPNAEAAAARAAKTALVDAGIDPAKPGAPLSFDKLVAAIRVNPSLIDNPSFVAALKKGGGGKSPGEIFAELFRRTHESADAQRKLGNYGGETADLGGGYKMSKEVQGWNPLGTHKVELRGPGGDLIGSGNAPNTFQDFWGWSPWFTRNILQSTQERSAEESSAMAKLLGKLSQ